MQDDKDNKKNANEELDDTQLDENEADQETNEDNGSKVVADADVEDTEDTLPEDEEVHLTRGGTLPLIPLRDLVIYPGITTSLYIGRRISLNALLSASNGDSRVVLVAQKEPRVENPRFSDLYDVGTLGNIIKYKEMADGSIRALVEGLDRVEVLSISDRQKDFYVCDYNRIKTAMPPARLQETMRRTLIKNVRRYIDIKERGEELASILSNLRGLERCVDTVASCFPLKLSETQRILALKNLEARFNCLMKFIKSELEVASMDNRIQQRVREQIDKNQKEYYLNEQVKAIKRELGGPDEKNDIEDLEERGRKKKFSEDGRAKFDSEIRKLKNMASMSAEATVVRNYLEWLLDLPWGTKTKSRNISLTKAEKILDREHHGLKEVKERILEYLALYRKVEKNKAPLVLFVGPPGVGKTSLGSAIAKATGRKLVRFSLGGVHDEAEIRGHRRTYIGAMPGKIVQKLAKAKVDNPLFLLDEIDKMSADFRGDPASALLEVLDPEQNNKFNDHYLEVDYDLSDIMFVCTANSINIPPALMDRMELIRLPGYTADEKYQIARKHLLPKQLKLCGLDAKSVKLTSSVLHNIIDNYTREAGVRELERQISKIMRKVVLLEERDSKVLPISINNSNLEDFLGVEKYSYTKLPLKEGNIGQVSGLAWTSVGGDILTIEASVVPGTGVVTKTGYLGEVMQESIKAAISIVRSRHAALGLPADFYQKCDYHIHVPEGATPKDGPSAGLAMCISLVSCLIGIPVRRDVAMTGEVTLRGDVLKIGGLKEKLLAAQRSKVRTVIIPEENERELKEISDNIKGKLDICPVSTIDEALQIAFKKLPKRLDVKKFGVTPTMDGVTESDNKAVPH